MDVPVRKAEPMNVEEYFAFTDSRPDNEKWELIEGEPVLQASPTTRHQTIVANVIYCLQVIRRERRPSWIAIPGIGVRVSDTSLPEPDILIGPPADASSRECDDIVVAIEVLSDSTADRDLRWKRKAYARLGSLMYYVVIAQDAVEVLVYARAANFAEQRTESLAASLELPALGISLPLTEIYQDTGLS
ncbi:MAG TPA: Uma2 family endonuclease [Xanthobacteraceae bacterium]|jgi:Uma2 family endonuclease